MILGLLQNAWSPLYANGRWPRDSWLKALHRSRSGQRLKILGDLDIYYDNTTPIVGEDPDSIVRPDPEHILGLLKTVGPEVVITFGAQAERAIADLWFGPHLILPHPAYRVVTNELFREAHSILLEGFEGKVKLTQKKGKVLRELGAPPN